MEALRSMPMKVYCSGCGYILWEKNATVEPEEVIRNYHGNCPNCKKPLVYDENLVRWTPV